MDMEMTREMVSIVLPTYNREKVIGRALGSILRQSYDRYEVIIVDDGSTDHTEEVIGQIKDDRLRYIRLESNQGAAHARNVGIRASKYRYVAFLDSDDEWYPDKLRLQMDKLQNAPDDVGLVYCRMGEERKDGNVIIRNYMPPYECLPESLEGDMLRFLLWKNLIGTPAMLVRRECLESAGLFKESLPCLEDYELVLRLAGQWKIAFVDEVLVEVHRTPGSLSSRIVEQLVVQCYFVSKYRQRMTAFGILEMVEEEIIRIAGLHGVQEEIKELLKRDFDL